MRQIIHVTILLVITIAVLPRGAGAAAPAQQQPDLNPPLFSMLFPSPTNNNGYEEFVRAADLVKGIGDVNAAMQTGATLEFKRRVLAMPACSRALSLIREGLLKPVKSPRASLDATTRFPELAPFRTLAKLMVVEQYVDFADGRCDAAVEDLRVGLAFGYRIQTDSLISGLVGIAVNSTIIREFATHFDQLSIYQCDDVLALAKQLLQSDSPGVYIIENEKAQTIQTLEKQRNNPKGLLALFAENGDPDDSTQDSALLALANGAGASSAGENSMIDAAEAKVSALYNQAAADLRLPISQRVPLTMDNSSTPGAALFRLVSVQPQRVVDSYTADQAKVKLLAVHVLIRRYQWDHNSLPGSLADLHADDLVIDPFTENLFSYKRNGDRYALSSAGPFKQDDVTGESTQVRNEVKLR